MENLKIKRLWLDARLPTRANLSDAGLDLYADERVNLPPGCRELVPTGIAVDIPHGYVGLVHPRSGLARRFGVTVLNAPGTIDAGFRLCLSTTATSAIRPKLAIASHSS